MIDTTSISAVISKEATIDAVISTEATIDVDIGAKMFDRSDFYSGSYAANALFHEQTFPTASKIMSRDFNVHAINYTEAPNSSGITVTIGG